ncbi:hypothetical protein [Terrarubrum flagellatum]|uniref:hypothetical protein n=1 Tax=Terrirubrum flagellatum TaxID=2895980 RepID=UPI003144F679
MYPKHYLDRYTYLKFFSPLNNQQIEAPISGYGSGWGARWQTNRGNGYEPGRGAECQREYALLRDAVRIAHHGNAHTPCGPRFRFDQTPLGLIPSYEEFYPETFIHALLGKGSPDEIIDTLRIAMAVGRIGSERDMNKMLPARATAAKYANDLMTLDCNGLVGNFYGGDPSASIDAYATPGRARKSLAEVRAFDCIVTHCPSIHFEHIALVGDVKPAGGAKVTIDVVEWGWFGGESTHYRPQTVEIVQGPLKQYGVGWKIISPHDNTTPSFRYIFAPPPPQESHGWS